MAGSSSVFPSVDNLEPGARKVCEAAVAIVEQSYAPYSKFRYEEEIKFHCYVTRQLTMRIIIQIAINNLLVS